MGRNNDKDYRKGFDTVLFGYSKSDVNKYIAESDRETAEKLEKAERQIEELKLRIAILEKKGIFGEKRKIMQERPVQEERSVQEEQPAPEERPADTVQTETEGAEAPAEAEKI